MDDRPAERERGLVVGVDARELQGKPTGTGRYLRNLLRQWSRTTADRFVAYVAGSGPVDPALDHPRILRRELGTGHERRLAWQEGLLPRAAAGDGLDVFFSPAYTCPLRLAVPRVTAVHDLAYFSHPQDFGWRHALVRRLLVALSIRSSRRILACSDFTRREIAGRFADAADRVVHVPLGPDDDLAPPREGARTRLGLAERPLVLTVGTVLNRRCLPELLRAVLFLRRRVPAVVLDVVGDNRTTPLLDLAGLVRTAGLEANVRLSGYVDEAGLADRYAAADAAVFLSEYEGFGLPALEAAARGVPLVVSDRPSLSEVFGEAALVVDPRDEGEIATGLATLLEDAELRRRLVERGRALAARHSWERTARLTREALVAAAGR